MLAPRGENGLARKSREMTHLIRAISAIQTSSMSRLQCLFAISASAMTFPAQEKILSVTMSTIITSMTRENSSIGSL